MRHWTANNRERFNAMSRAAKQRWRDRGNGRPKVDYAERPCENCKALFKPKTKRARYCSAACNTLGYRAANREASRKWARQHYARHSDQIRAAVKQWQLAHPEYVRANGNARKIRVRRQTPAWANMAAIVDFYMRTPAGQEVDHIVPLRGRLVSGLHVEYNLQYLPMSANRAKGASYAAL